MKKLLLLLCITFGPIHAQNIDLDYLIKHAEQQYSFMMEVYPDSSVSPFTVNQEGYLLAVNTNHPFSGCFSGSCWMLYQLTKDNYWKHKSSVWTEKYLYAAAECSTPALAHALVNAHQQTNKASYEEVLLLNARNKAKQLRNQGAKSDTFCFRNLLEHEFLQWAFQTIGDSVFFKKMEVDCKNMITILNQNKGILKDSLVFDASAKQWEAFSSVSVQKNRFRNYAFAIKALVDMYVLTKSPLYLQQIDFLLKHVLTICQSKNTDCFSFELGVQATKDKAFMSDATGGAIFSSALLDLVLSLPKNQSKAYQNTAMDFFEKLCRPEFLSNLRENGFYILKHGAVEEKGIIIDKPNALADYYFLKAVVNLSQLDAMEK